MNRLEHLFERALWSSRLLMLIGVVVSLVLAVAAFVMATVDGFAVFKHLADYADLGLSYERRADLRAAAITLIVKSVDGYLIAAILLVFALGLYELFINKLDVAKRSENAPRLLQVESLDDLKSRIAGLLLLVLVIEFFQRALRLDYDTPLDLLTLAAGVLLISTAFYLSNVRLKHRGADAARREHPASGD